MTTLDFAAIEQAPLAHDPYDHLIVPGAITAAAMAAINDDFPSIDTPGSHPVATLDYGPAFAAFLDTLRDKPFARTIGAKLGLTLDDKPVMITVRGRCRKTDGKIHIDSSGKLVTVLIYMNNAWEAAGGQLRLLRNSHDIDDYAVELPPAAGTMLVFPCTPESWHGHQPFEGERRAIQLNWVRSNRYKWREQVRHAISSTLKKLRGKGR
jgi:SM-20-related protein